MKRVCALMTGVVILSGAALADDVLPPVWRGESNTVYAEWDSWEGFNTTPTPFYPDNWYSNPVGLSSPDSQAYDTAQYLSSYADRNDVVEIDGMSQIDFLMPNFVDQDQTELWIQLTYWVAETTEVTFLLDTDPYTDDINGPYLQGSVEHDSGWVTEAYSFTILPSVDAELITLDFADASSSTPIYLDQVVIDSVAVPEPTAAVLLVALAALGLARRR